MNKQQTLDAVYGVLVTLRADHPHGLRAVGSANASAVFTRHGIAPQVAEMISITFEYFEEECGGISNPMEIVEGLAGQLRPDGTLKNGFTYPIKVIQAGEKDGDLFTHPDLLFTAVNWNGRRYGIEADASAAVFPGGLDYYQDWKDSSEILGQGIRVLKAWDAVEGRFLEASEIDVVFHTLPNS